MAPKNTPNTYDLTNFKAQLNATLDRVETDPEFAADLVAEHQGNPITLGPLVISPEEWATEQVKNAASASGKWLDHVLKPRRDPLKAAIAAAPKRTEKVRLALEEKKWEKAMAKVDEDLMFATIRKRGAAAFRSGVEDRKEKVLARAKELQPLVTALKKTIQAMPDVTDADRIARLLAGREGMIEIGKRRRGL